MGIWGRGHLSHKLLFFSLIFSRVRLLYEIDKIIISEHFMNGNAMLNLLPYILCALNMIFAKNFDEDNQKAPTWLYIHANRFVDSNLLEITHNEDSKRLVEIREELDIIQENARNISNEIAKLNKSIQQFEDFEFDDLMNRENNSHNYSTLLTILHNKTTLNSLQISLLDLLTNSRAKFEEADTILERGKVINRYFSLHGLYKIGVNEEEYSMPEYYKVDAPDRAAISYRNEIWSIHDGATLLYTNQNQSSLPPENGWILRNGSVDHNLVLFYQEEKKEEKKELPFLIYMEGSNALSTKYRLAVANKDAIDYFEEADSTGYFKLNNTNLPDNERPVYTNTEKTWGKIFYRDNIWQCGDGYKNFAQTRSPPQSGWRWSPAWNIIPRSDPAMELFYYPAELSKPPTALELKTISENISGKYTLLGTRHNHFPTYKFFFKRRTRYLYVRKYTNLRYLWVTL